ncbi:efflux RND transporter permease subunit [Methylocapsa sp. D3K7]|uniref:efflux RND transporter permease subunit n=1 Tax=Methylocapsa sp. D3K7 TaxID=3041435 RepID=UPI00244EC47A|nr:efflux RND transporter permease subunit [Methylocapsa sp. D3K7]WGJ14312.1 efflux RND transporter permease subunit [Methylocapsa sp. D3K7]
MTGPNLSVWALTHRSFVIFAMVAVTIAGLASYFRLGRSEDPAFTFRTMIVQASWPGATLDDTLQQVTERLERKLQETKGLDYLRSYTSPGITTIFVNLKGSTKASEVPDIWYQVRKNVSDIRHTLPSGVVGPGFNDDFGDTYGLIYGFTADGFTHRELRDYVEDIRSRLLQVPDVSKIEILGVQDEQIFVEFSTQQLAGLGINRAALIAALQAQNAVSPAGSLQTGNEKLLIRVSGAFRSENDILDVNFLSNGRLIRLRDIAEVRRALADPPQPMFRVNGKPAIGLAIAMRDGGDILALGRNVKKAVDESVADLPLGIDATLVSDQPVVVKTAIGEFMESLWQAIAIIMAVSVVSLGIRPGAVVALSIPLTMAIIFPIMELLGIDLQRISLGALIIALGLLVDDAMTTVDVMTSRLAAGDSKEESATFAYKTLAFPMLTGSFVTAAGFVPIGFARSAAGEYTFSIFAVVSLALIVSWFVAVLFAPLLGVWLLKKPETKEPAQQSVILRMFRSILVGAMRMRWLTIALTLACFAASLLALPYVPRQFFPASDRPELVVDLTLPQNASIYASDQAAAKLDAILKDDPDVASWSTYVGRGAIRFYLPLNVQLANDFFSQAVVIAKNIAARERLHARLEKTLAEQLPSVVARVSPLELGPPVGWPVQYRVSGPDLAEVRAIALRLGQVMGTDSNVRLVNFDWIEPARKVRIQIDQDQARLLGLSSQALAEVLNTVMTGTPVTQVRDNIYLVNVVTRAQDEQRVSLSTLRALQLPLPNGRTVPLSQVASFDFEQEFPLIWRRQRVPTLTVQADIASGATPEAAVRSLAPAVEKLNAGLPKGYHIEVGGTVEESAQSQASVFAKVPLMLFLMLLFLMAQLHSFSRLALVLCIVPMGLIGIVTALLIFGRPLGFVAILGILALMGMIARNAVILIEQIETERAEGQGPWDAVVLGTLSRFRPIMLTAISTVLGFIPIAPTVFWGPMAFAIMGGLFVATMLTLIVLPALYVAWFRVKEPLAEGTAPR